MWLLPNYLLCFIDYLTLQVNNSVKLVFYSFRNVSELADAVTTGVSDVK